MCQNCKNWKGFVPNIDVRHIGLGILAINEPYLILVCLKCYDYFVDTANSSLFHYNFTKPTPLQETEIICLKLKETSIL